jgi:hypothetical protein
LGAIRPRDNIALKSSLTKPGSAPDLKDAKALFAELG